MRRYLTFLFALFFYGCAGQVPYVDVTTDPAAANSNSLEACKAFYLSLDQAVDRAGVRDAQWHRITGYPFLRTNRFLAGYRHTPMGKKAFKAWIDRMQDLDKQARDIEIRNLAGTTKHQTALNAQDSQQLKKTMHECSNLLRGSLKTDPETARKIRARAEVPDEYQTWKRWLGVYPVSSLFVKWGINDYQQETHSDFRRPLHTLTAFGLLKRYVPPSSKALQSNDIATIIAEASNNPLGIPDVEGATLQQLLNHFAPVLEVDVSGHYDRIGKIQIDRQQKPMAATSYPVVYVSRSFTHYRGAPLLQLNYTFWFPKRPAQSAFDILSGHLDGITYRITLASSGEPVMYDAMHNCGCYHMFFPASNFHLKAAGRNLPEPPLIPQRAPKLSGHERMVIRIGSEAHQIQRLYKTSRETDGTAYQFLHYNELRSLNAGDGKRRSLFAADGIVKSTQRKERFLLWPMGVPAPGAMRQFGHHAIAFRGRRHFDDADLLEKLFTTQ